MKVVHILKKIESIDNDIKDLRKMEKSLQKNKSFTTPIYLSIEKQINILLDERIKMMGLKIENPPEYLVEQIEGKPAEPQPAAGSKPASPKSKSKKAKPAPVEERIEDDFPDDDIPLLTQDLIDERIKKIEVDTVQTEAEKDIDIDSKKSDSVKLLDLALEKGTLNKSDIEKEKKKVRFFKENFPGGEY